MSTVHVSIGNTDGKLSHTEWSQFCALADELATETVATAIYGRWHSLPATPYVYARRAVEIPEELLPDFKVVLAELARKFRQDSIALLVGTTEFVTGTTDGA